METNQEKRYQFCVSCGDQLNPQDSRGWLHLKPESDMFLCPGCILDSEAHLDEIQLKNEKYYKIVRVLADFKYLLDEMDAEDKPKGE